MLLNKDGETGLPYDIVISGPTGDRFVEVKSSTTTTKRLFKISSEQWRWATEHPDAFDFFFVHGAESENARVTVLRNPARLAHMCFYLYV